MKRQSYSDLPESHPTTKPIFALHHTVITDWIGQYIPTEDDDSGEIFKDGRVVIAEKIISLQVAFYTLRTAEIYFINSEITIWNMINALKEQYLLNFGHEYPDGNKDVNW